MNNIVNINEILNGVGKKLRNSFCAGKTSEKEIVAVFNRNKKEADAFDGYGWSVFDITNEMKNTHNPLLRIKLQNLIEEHKEKSRVSVSQNRLSLLKLDYYNKSALGCGIRSVRNTLYKIGKGDVDATILAMLIDVEYANLMAKKHTDKKHVIYERKTLLLQQVSDLLYDNGWRCGISSTTGKNAGYLIYVYLTDNIQLSWHCNEYTMLYYYDDIECEWDGRPCTTLEKLMSYAHSKYNIGEPLVPYDISLAA